MIIKGKQGINDSEDCKKTGRMHWIDRQRTVRERYNNRGR